MEQNNRAKDIYIEIRDMIKLGKYKEFDPIPSENTLKTEYGVSRATIRKALGKLVEDQYIYPAQGKGYYVQKQDYGSYLFNYAGLDESLIKHTSVRIMTATEMMGYELYMPPSTKVVQTSKIACNGDETIGIEYIVVPYSLNLRMSEKELSEASLMEIMSAIEDMHNIRCRMTISCCVARDNTCKDMNIPLKSKVVRVDRIVSNLKGENIAWSMTCYVPKYFKMSIHRGLDI